MVFLHKQMQKSHAVKLRLQSGPRSLQDEMAKQREVCVHRGSKDRLQGAQDRCVSTTRSLGSGAYGALSTIISARASKLNTLIDGDAPVHQSGSAGTEAPYAPGPARRPRRRMVLLLSVWACYL